MIAGAASCFHLAAGPLLAQDDRATPIESRDVKQVLADIDTDHGDSRIELLCHGVLVVFGAPCQLLLLAGPEHGRTIPLPVIGPIEIQQRSSLPLDTGVLSLWKSTSRAIECRRPPAIIRQRSGCGAAGLGEHRTEPFKNADPIAARPLRKFYSRLVSQAELAAHSAWIEQNRHALKIE
jgi:hypothetical protein